MTTHTTAATSEASSSLGRRLTAGAVGGVAGGVVFGAMMGMMGMLPMIAGMMGSSSAAVGGVIHMMISIVYGVLFVLIANRWLGSWGASLLAGAGYGIVLWVFGSLLVMPLMAGMPVFAISGPTMMSLLGHIIYGLLVAAVAMLMLRRHG